MHRHIDLVYHAALRQVGGNGALAEEVTQCVFTDLARKAKSLAQRPAIVSWLYTSTRFAAAKARRTEHRRQLREHAAHVMQETNRDFAESERDWQRLRPMIDDVLRELDERDQEAVLRRFFEGQSFSEIGAQLAMTEDTARVRVSRALDKLQGLLARRGITSTAAALGIALANQAGVAAPAGLATAAVTAALAGTVVSGGVVATAFMALSKVQISGIAAVLIAISGGLLWQNQNPKILPVVSRQAAPAGSSVAAGLAVTAMPDVRHPALPEAPTAEAKPAYVATVMHQPTHRGRATPMDAYETLQWAAVAGEIQLVADLLVLPPRSLREAEELLATAPEQFREKYPTPQLMAALVYSMGWRPDEIPRPGEIQVLGEDAGVKVPEIPYRGAITISTYWGLPEETSTNLDYRTLRIKERSGGKESEVLGHVLEKTADGWSWVVQPGLLKSIYRARIQKK